MKKIVLFLEIVIGIIIINMNIEAATWRFVWNNTTVEVPVGTSIYDYEKIPQAKLYKDNVELTDADIKIVTTGDWLYYLSNVNTSKVGEYCVWYKAYEYKYMPGTCHDYKCLITFRVVDNEKPNISQITNNIKIAKGTKNINLEEYFNVTDNYDKNINISFVHNIDTSKVGFYNCQLTAIDDYNNEETLDFVVEVYNAGSAPVIEMIVNEIKIKKNSKIDLEKYFKIVDNDLDKITTSIYHTIDINTPGVYECEITASDGNDITSYKFCVEVYDDNEAPVISQLIEEIKIEAGCKYSLSDYFIITDDYSNDIKPKFVHNINDNIPGIYDCSIIATDESGKMTTLTFLVEVYKNEIAPVIEQLVDEIRIKRNSKYDLSTYFSVLDDTQDKVECNFYHLIDVMVVGFYECKMVAVDSNGNSTIHTFIVEVYDDNPPKIIFLGEGLEINIYLRKEITIQSYFMAMDDIDGDITNNIVFPAIDKNTPGTFDYMVWVEDNANNKTELKLTINIIDDIEPQIVLYNDFLTLEYGFTLESIDYLSYVKIFNDNNQNMNKTLIEVDTNLSTNVGTYSVFYTYSDGTNIALKELVVTVLATKPPVITVDIVKVIKGEIVNLYNYVIVTDESDSNVNNTLVIDDSNVDYFNTGRYEVTAYAINSSGLSTTLTFYVVVEEENIFNYDYVSYIFLGLILLLAGSIYYIYFVKKKNIKLFK